MSESPDVIHVGHDEPVIHSKTRRPIEKCVWVTEEEYVSTISVRGRCYEVIKALSCGIRCLDLDTLDVVVLELE